MKHRRFGPYPTEALSPEQKIARMRSFVEEKLTEISDFFIGEVKFTFIARVPGKPEQDVLISSDPDIDELAALIERSRTREAK